MMERGEQKQQPTELPSSSKVVLEPSLNTFYYIQRSDDSWWVAEIIQRRDNSEHKRAEFYVHYKDCESLVYNDSILSG